MEDERKEESVPGLPPGPEETELDRLRAELEEAQRQWTYFRNLLQRVQADFANYRKQVEAEKEEHRRTAAADLLKRLLPVVDDLDRAVAHIPEGTDPSWAEGLRLIHRKLHRALEEAGLQRIPALGRPFDPWEHEVLAFEETEAFPEGEVIEVLREGYKLHGRVLRPALVRVAKAPSRPAQGDPSPAETQETDPNA